MDNRSDERITKMLGRLEGTIEWYNEIITSSEESTLLQLSDLKYNACLQGMQAIDYIGVNLKHLCWNASDNERFNALKLQMGTIIMNVLSEENGSE